MSTSRDQSRSPSVSDETLHDLGDAVPEHSRRVAPVIVLVVAVVIAAFFVILIRAKSDTTESAYSPLVGKSAPSVATETLDGKSFDLQRRKGSWVVLNFFDATCVPCVQEHPEIVKFAEQQQQLADGAEFYSVVWNNRNGETTDFFEANPVSWPVLLDKNAQLAGAFGVSKVPETWIIDPNGYVAWHSIAEQTVDSLTRALNTVNEIYDRPVTVGSVGG
jgi:cytochrome c biogenesis protein CcmG, thiol:disulfide interchange protein DsbE